MDNIDGHKCSTCIYYTFLTLHSSQPHLGMVTFHLLRDYIISTVVPTTESIKDSSSSNSYTATPAPISIS